MKREITPRAIAFVLLGVAVVLGAAGWFLLVSPKRSQASKLASTIQTKQSQVSTETHQSSTVAGSAPAATLGQALPDVPGMPDVVDQLNALATRSGVALDTITPQAAVPGTGFEAIPLTVVVDGRYFAIEKFLQLVRKEVQVDKSRLVANGRLFDVQGVQLQQTEPAPSVTATLSLRTFYYDAGAADATATTTDGTTTTSTDTTTTATTTTAAAG
jgi:Tfp pilus assembly protein PilO